jgi:L-ascorbate metabolism protein UlaG (beta-lactamase superfamily)
MLKPKLFNMKKLNKNILIRRYTLCVLSFFSSAGAMAQIEGSSAFTFKENNNHIIELQKRYGNALKNSDVKITYYGHMAFKITSPEGLTIMIDPWRNDPTGTFGIWYPQQFPDAQVDIVMSSHAHFDHDAVYRPHASMVLDRMAGEFKLADVKISGIADKHQSHAPGEVKWDQLLKDKFNITNIYPPDNGMSWDNVIFVIETGGLRLGFWGDNRPDPGPEVVKAFAGLDVLILNIDDSEHTLSYPQIAKILDRFRPRAVIPGHYLTKGATLPISGLKSAQEWVNKQKDKTYVTSPELTINKKSLEGARRRVYYFGDHYQSL